MTMFREIARETFFGEGGTIGNGTMVAVVSFVGTSHCNEMVSDSRDGGSGMTYWLIEG